MKIVRAAVRQSRVWSSARAPEIWN